MRCKQCGETVANPTGGYDAYPYGEAYACVCTHAVCPVCGADEWEEESICRQCAEEVNECDMTDGFCRYCAEELEQTLEWVCSMLTPAQLWWMRMHPEWMERGEDGC